MSSPLSPTTAATTSKETAVSDTKKLMVLYVQLGGPGAAMSLFFLHMRENAGIFNAGKATQWVTFSAHVLHCLYLSDVCISRASVFLRCEPAVSSGLNRVEAYPYVKQT
jgi:hypothetical protein